jgi:hypothetical protein
VVAHGHGHAVLIEDDELRGHLGHLFIHQAVLVCASRRTRVCNKTRPGATQLQRGGADPNAGFSSS